MSSGSDEFLTVADIARILRLNQQTGGTGSTREQFRRSMSADASGCAREEFDALVERGRTAPSAPNMQSPAQPFWDGELLPVQVIDAEAGGKAVGGGTGARRTARAKSHSTASA